MKYIVYKTTCLINGKIYIGVHGTENPDVPDGYVGDGIATYFTYFIKHPKWPFQHAVAKYGIENFKREILYVYDSEKDAYLKEEELVNAEFIARKDTYNIALGGQYIKKISSPIYQFTLDGKLIKNMITLIKQKKKLESEIVQSDIVHESVLLETGFFEVERIALIQMNII